MKKYSLTEQDFINLVGCSADHMGFKPVPEGSFSSVMSLFLRPYKHPKSLILINLLYLFMRFQITSLSYLTNGFH